MRKYFGRNIRLVLVIGVCVFFVALAFSGTAPKPPTPKSIELLPMAQPNTPNSGFIIYCDNADGNLKALDMYGETTILAIPQPPQPPAEYNVGIYEHPSGSGCTGLIKTLYDDIVMSVKSYDETSTILELPKYADTWTEIHNGVTVDYNHAEGIYFTGVSPEYYRAINATAITENDYTINMKIHFTDRWHRLGCVFNYEDENNYCMAYLYYDRDEFKEIDFESIIDGVLSTQWVFYPTSANTDYDFKVKVSNTNDLAYIYVNNVLELTVSLS